MTDAATSPTPPDPSPLGGLRAEVRVLITGPNGSRGAVLVPHLHLEDPMEFDYDNGYASADIGNPDRVQPRLVITLDGEPMLEPLPGVPHGQATYLMASGEHPGSAALIDALFPPIPATMPTATPPDAAADRVATWLDDDDLLRIPDTAWGRRLHADLRTLVDIANASRGGA